MSPSARRRNTVAGLRSAAVALLLLACAERASGAASTAWSRSSSPSAFPLTPTRSESVASPASARPEPPATSCPALDFEVGPEPEDAIDAPVPEVSDPTGAGLDSFYARLARQLRDPSAPPVRVGFYGDSNLTLDVISGTLRRELQARFGDAGHGYVGVGSPFRGYRHRDVRRRMVGTWKTFLYSHHTQGRYFGAAGMAAETSEPNARALFRTADENAPVGRTASRFLVFYLKQPDAGRFAIGVDDEPAVVVDTAAASAELGFEIVQVADTAHRFEVKHLEHRPIRLFGVALERSRAGVMVDSFGVTGTTYYHLARMDEPVSRSMLEQRAYDLVLFLVGTNSWRFEQNPQAAGQVFRMHRQVRPGLPIVVMSPPDHVLSKQSPHSDPRVVEVADQLREIARTHRCGFWDFREAMGGDGSMRKFYYAGLAGADLYHLTDRGAEVMGRRVAYALLRGLDRYLDDHPHAGCD